MNSETAPASAANEPWLEVHPSPHFRDWLVAERISLAITTYQTGKLILVGVQDDRRLSIFERNFQRCMGLWGDGQTLWMNTVFQLWRFENILLNGNLRQGFDRVYIPRIGYTTGDLDIHDVHVESSGRVVFVCTRLNCLATLSPRDSFSALWRPAFISKLVPEDRCHLNGLALEEGRARYVTAVSTTDVLNGWREGRRDGGVVIDVRSNRIVAGGLSMPHSPRVHRGRLWLHNSGTGYFGSVDLDCGAFEPLTFCPGYLRGLAFVGDYAVMGLSGPRHDKMFGGLRLEESLAARNDQAVCGLHVVDLRSGNLVHWLHFEGKVSELYDVVVLPNVGRPMALGFMNDEIERLLTMGPAGTLS